MQHFISWSADLEGLQSGVTEYNPTPTQTPVVEPVTLGVNSAVILSFAC